MAQKHPPQPTHVPGTVKGEELALHHKEPGRGQGPQYRSARDSTGVCANKRQPIHPKMPHIPPS
jgi:hypothetical protein